MRAARVLRFGAALAAGSVLLGCSSRDSADPSGGQALAPPHELELVDVAAEVGLRFRHGAFRWRTTPDPPAMTGGGLCWLDYDDDGRLDLFVVNSYAEAEAPRWRAEGGLPATALFRNEGGHFAEVSAEAHADLAVRGSGCVAADFDLDGHTDLYVTTARVNALLWNEGDGTFTEGAVEAGVAAYGWRTGAAVADVNGDGLPDLFVAGYADLANPNRDATTGFPNTYLGVRDLLFLNEGPGEDGRVTFREVGTTAGLEASRFEYGLGALFTDVDRDGDADLYVANDTNPNRLYVNVPWPGGAEADPDGLGFRFEERSAAAGVADAGAGMGIGEADYDGDGRPDLFVTNARNQVNAVFRSRPPDEHGAVFADARAHFGLDSPSQLTGWGASWADLDLDADPDLLVANGRVPVTSLADDAEPLRLFENLSDEGSPGRFDEVGSRVGLAAVGLLNARGSAAADYDNDGDLDVAVNQVGGRLVLLENRVAGRHWLEVALDGFHPGAVVTAVLQDGRELRCEVHAGSSYLSSEDPRCHFGLGAERRLRSLVVRWPGGGESRLDDVEADRRLVVEEPE